MITLLGAICDAIAVSAGFQAARPMTGLLCGTLLGVGVLHFAGAGYATTRRAGTVTMGGSAGALAGFIGGIGFAVTWSLIAPLALRAQLGSLLVDAGWAALYGVIFLAPVGTALGALLGMLGARAGIARRRERAAT
jgi:hypothetical protein